MERYRCCTSQWQPGSGFPEAYAAWIQGRYVSAGLLGIDVGDTDLDTDLVRRVRFGDRSVALTVLASHRSEPSTAPNTWCFVTSKGLRECNIPNARCLLLSVTCPPHRSYQHFRRQPRYQTNRLVTLVATIPTLRVTNFLWFCDVYGRAAGAAVAFATEPPPTTGIPVLDRVGDVYV